MRLCPTQLQNQVIAGGSVDREINAIAAARTVEYAGYLQQMVKKMVLSETAVNDTDFKNTVTCFPPCGAASSNCLFAQIGGGVKYAPPQQKYGVHLQTLGILKMWL